MIRQPGRAHRDRRRCRSGRVDYPASARCRAGVSGGVRLAHLERVSALRKTGIWLRARAGGERRAVEGALERGGRFAREREGGRGLVGLPGRTNRDRRRRGRRGIDRPASTCRGAGVTGGVDLAHLERMGTVSETAVGLRARAGRKRRAVERALEAGTRLSGEGEGGRGLIDQPGRAHRDARRCRSGRVDRPRVARCHSRVPCRVGLPHLERVARGRQATVSPRARAGGERRAVERALERGTHFSREREGRCGRVRRVGRRRCQVGRRRRRVVDRHAALRGVGDVSGDIGCPREQLIRAVCRLRGPRGRVAWPRRARPDRRIRACMRRRRSTDM